MLDWEYVLGMYCLALWKDVKGLEVFRSEQRESKAAAGLDWSGREMALISALSSALQEAEEPQPDPLAGLRVHAWVLVLSGKREVPENFFINPFTGHSHSTTDGHFLGVESVWNHRNYWVNMQDCRNGCKVTNRP